MFTENNLIKVFININLYLTVRKFIFFLYYAQGTFPNINHKIDHLENHREFQKVEILGATFQIVQ